MRRSFAEYICRCTQALLKRSTLWALAGLLEWSSLIRICSICWLASFYYCAEFASADVNSAPWSGCSGRAECQGLQCLSIFAVTLNFSAILVPNIGMLTVQTLVRLLRSSSLTRVCTFCHLIWIYNHCCYGNEISLFSMTVYLSDIVYLHIMIRPLYWRGLTMVCSVCQRSHCYMYIYVISSNIWRSIPELALQILAGLLRRSLIRICNVCP